MAHVTYVFQVIGEDYDGERTGYLIFAKVQEVDSFVAYLHVEDLPGNTLGLSYVSGGFVEGEAIGGA
jgi:hypothetical protein